MGAGVSTTQDAEKAEGKGKEVLGVPVEEEKPDAEKVEQRVQAVDVGMSPTPVRFNKRAMVRPWSSPLYLLYMNCETTEVKTFETFYGNKSVTVHSYPD